MAELEKKKRLERAQAIGLFRYQLICPAIDAGLSTKARGRVVREIAARTHTDPFGEQVHYSRHTLDRWIRRWRSDGFDALVPSARQPSPRTEDTVLELAAGLKRENPDRTTAQVARIMRSATGWAPSESTLLRLFHRLELIGPAVGVTGEVFGRFEAARCNEIWTGDALHGKRIGGRKTYLFAFIDDRSRLLVGYRFGFAEDTVRLASALEKALTARGIPEYVYVDNGSAFVDAWLLRACAKLGVKLTHSTPHRPQGRGKIERFFRTVRDQFLVEVSDTDAETLAASGVDHATALLELNRRFTAWVETQYHRHVHTETRLTPLERWNEDWTGRGQRPVMADAEQLTEAFLWSERRKVTKTATVSLHSNIYQVDPALTGRRVELVFSPFNLEDIDVRHNDRSYGTALPHNITRHAHPKARPEIPPVEPVVATGIDFHQLTTRADDERTRADQRIGYDALYGTAEIPGEIPGQLALVVTDTDTDTDTEGQATA